MKKFICSVLGAAVLMSCVPFSAAAKGSVQVIGDINCDGEVNAADLVLLHKYMIGSEDFQGENYKYKKFADVNMDGSVNVFDLIQLRKSVIFPNAVREIKTEIEEVFTDDNGVGSNKIIRTVKELRAEMEKLSLASGCRQNLLDKYNDEFFTSNVLYINVIDQERGTNIAYDTVAVMRVPNLGRLTSILGTLNNGEPSPADKELISSISEKGAYVVGITSSFEGDYLLYPQTNMKLLVETVIPKECADDVEAAVLFDSSKFLQPERSSYVYSSPDGNVRFFVTQEASLLSSVNRIYLESSDGSRKFLTYCDSDDGGTPFDGEGTWSKDENGCDVFSNGKSFGITWFEDHILLRSEFSGNLWREQVIFFDGTLEAETMHEYNQ